MPKTILLVDDSEDDVFFITRAFKTARLLLPLAHVNNGQKAIDYLSGTAPYDDRAQFPWPSLILLDLKMPFLSGALASRVELKAGSFFESVPTGGDAYLMRHIIHDWSDEHCRAILGQIHKVMPAGGKLLIVENVIRAGNDPDFAKLLDLEMLTMTDGGKERTEEEFAALFASAGFRLTRVVKTEAPICVVEGEKAKER